MVPNLICIRHAQGFHNLGPEFHSLPDPKLTELGEQQCAILRDGEIIDQSKISLVTTSPLTRTIATAYLSFKPAFENGKCKPKIIAIPDTQETSDFPCDTGSDLEVLRKRCEEEKWPVDLSRLTEDWNVKTLDSRYSPAGDKIEIRAQAARRQLRQLLRGLVAAGDKDAQVVLVTHGGYLHYFTDDWADSDKYYGTGWLNTETRSYTFKDGIESDNEDATLLETDESRDRRGKDTPTVDKDKQGQLVQESCQNLDDQGLENGIKAKA